MGTTGCNSGKTFSMVEWIKRVVVIADMPDTGRMDVVATDGDQAGCVPRDPDSTVGRLANIGGDSVLWFKKRDLKECPLQEETLL